MKNRITILVLAAFLSMLWSGWQQPVKTEMKGCDWLDGQLPHTSNPNVYSCANAGCHGGTPPDANLQVTTGTGSPCWNPGTNVIQIQPVLATEVAGVFVAGDTSLQTFGYTANIAAMNGQPIPGAVINFSTCMAGTSRRYTVNGLWFAEHATPGQMYWVGGNPGIRTWGMVCTFTFNINSLIFSDSIRVNVCVVVANNDSTRFGDSTICKSITLCYDGPLQVHTGPYNSIVTSQQNNKTMSIYQKEVNGITVAYMGNWRLIDFTGRLMAAGRGRKYVSLPSGIYILELIQRDRIVKEQITVI